MFDYVSLHMRRAAELLTGQDAPLQARLVEAGNEFWATMAHPEDWPAELLETANRTLNCLLAGGMVQLTVAQMDFDTVRAVAQRILDLAAQVEAIRNERLHPSRTS